MLEKLTDRSTKRADAQITKEFREHREMRAAVVNNWTGLQKFVDTLKNSLPLGELRKVQKEHHDEKGTRIIETHIDPATHIKLIYPLKLVEKEFDIPLELEHLNGSAEEKRSVRLSLYIDDELGEDEDESSPFFKFTRLTSDEGRVSYRVGGEKHEFDSRQMKTPEEFQQQMESALGAIKELGVDPYLLDDLLPISGNDLY